MKTALSIAGSDSIGGAGIQADIKAMLANGVYAMTVITALTAQNTLGINGIYPIPSEFVGIQTDAVFSDIFPDAVKIGMTYSSENTAKIAEKLKYYQAVNIVCDPVMISTSGTILADENSADAVKKYLIPIASLITPNIPEAEILSGIRINTPDDMIKAAETIFENYGCPILLKGGHSADSCDDLLYKNGSFKWFCDERKDNPNTHGTGCTLSSAIAANLAKGYDLERAVGYAKKYISGAIGAMLETGKGIGSLDHGFDIKSEFI